MVGGNTNRVPQGQGEAVSREKERDRVEGGGTEALTAPRRVPMDLELKLNIVSENVKLYF